jgi:hypothetical protein
MGKLFRGVICCMALFFVCSITRGDAIDNFAKALKQLAAPKQIPGGKLSGEEGYTIGKDGELVLYGSTTEHVDPFYLKPLEERLEYLNKYWDNFDNLTPQVQAMIKKYTFETILLTLSSFLRDGLGTIRGAIELVAPQLAFAKAPVEDFADFVFLLGYLSSKIINKAYQENLQKLYWISTCMTKNAQSRESFAPKSGELVCKNLGCVKSKKCVAVFFDYAIKAFEPWILVSVTGIDADGRHIKGIFDTIILVAVPGNDKIVKDFGKASKILNLTLKLMTTSRNSMIKAGI